jgi:hypothetical protein
MSAYSTIQITHYSLNIIHFLHYKYRKGVGLM